jgi:4-hydroxythreonine-4-phosphate dehydrogenase
LNGSLKRDFGIDKPRIAVLGLNPHAGDDGLIGSEEQTIIKPAIRECKDKGALVFGPYSADAFFRPWPISIFRCSAGNVSRPGSDTLQIAGCWRGSKFHRRFTSCKNESLITGPAFDIAGKGKSRSVFFPGGHF